MGQLESLRELSITEPNNRKWIREKYAIVVHSDENSSEAWNMETLHIKIIWKLHNLVLIHFTLLQLVMPWSVFCKWLDFKISIHCEDGIYPFKLAN